MIHPEAKPPSDVLCLQASAHRDLPASHLEVHLQVTSSSSVQSSEASRAVAEIRELLQGLAELGIDGSQAEIKSATVAEGKGMFGRGSTARFQVLLRRVPPDKLVGVLQTATRLPHTEHDGTVWQFDIEEELRDELIGQATTKARRRAEAAVEPLGVRLGGVQRCDLSLDDGQFVEGAPMPMGAPMPAKKRMVSSIQSETGIELMRSIRVTATANVSFHLER